MSKIILTVEDQEDNRRILRDLLESAGYEVLEAVTGKEGVSAAETHRPDLILMDVQLPGLDGYEATRRIKANPDLCRTPIISDDCRLVPHACCSVMPGVSGERPVDSSASRARFQSFEWVVTAPATTSSIRLPPSPKRSTTPWTAAASISRLVFSE